MLRAIIFILLFNSFLFSFDRNLIFAPLPLEDKKTMYLRFSPMLDVLEKKLNTKIDINYNSSYDEILEKFIKGKIDFAYLGPLPYLTLEQKFKHIKPIVNFKNKKGEGSYTCSFVI